MLYDDLRVNENDVDISRDVQVEYDRLVWTRTMAPGESMRVSISYRTRGVEHFYYQVPNPRELRDFSFEMRVDGLTLSQVNYPEGCLTPHRLESTDSGVLLEWELDRAVTTAGLGIALPKPAQPGAKVSQVLSRSPYALMLLVVAVCLTLLVRGDPVSLLDLSLLSSVYCALFLTMAAASETLLGFWGSLAAGGALTLGLAAALYRNHPARATLLVLAGFFTAIYPLSALFPDHVENFDGMVVVALIVYLFVIAVRQRLR